MATTEQQEPRHVPSLRNHVAFSTACCCQIGGTVSGLVGSGLVLQLDAGPISEYRPIVGNGLYRFAASVAPGTTYSIGITGQPDSQTCTLSLTDGTMGSADVENANVACGGNLVWDQGNWGEPWR